jgi:hypothetical protein
MFPNWIAQYKKWVYYCEESRESHSTPVLDGFNSEIITSKNDFGTILHRGSL